ncbi:Transcriptional adapter 2-beta [Exaiptasia diaphana]|nr:Transcriptional adapter 2-beta [Exaiptasia diaphana]
MAANEYHCNYCQSDCTLLRVRCAECSDFDLCLQCFCCGAEMGEHKREHKYQLIDGGSFPLFSEEWAAEEETLLLDAIEQHGFGNWDDIADHIGTKTAAATAEHYNDVYIHGNIGKASVEPFKDKIVDHTAAEGGLLSPTLLHPPEQVEMSTAEQTELGYMPLRDDFEKEYDNDAETLISGLQFNKDDDDLETVGQEFDEQRLRRERRKENKRKMVGGTTPRKTNVSLGKIQMSSEKSKKSDKNNTGSANQEFLDEIKSSSCFDLLSSREVQLCSTMQMKPGFYLTIKIIILKDNLLRRQGVQVKTRYPPNLDKTHRRLIVSYLKESGWIPTS